MAHAQMSPLGLWKSIDEKTGEVTGEIRIVKTDGIVSGRIEKALGSKAKLNETCAACKDDRKGQLINGLEIIRGAKKTDGKDIWEGGTILDPEDGAIYKLTMTPVDDGKKLQIRGFVGFSLFGRTQTWHRAQ